MQNQKNENFIIALLQIFPGKNIQENMKKGLEFCKKAKEKGTHLVVFPEMWSTGYEMLFEGNLKDQKKFNKKR